MCFYLPNTPAKKKSQEETGSAGQKSQSRENGAQILQQLKAWEVGTTHPCSQVWPRCWGHREPQERTKWGPGCPATLPLWVVRNNLVLIQGQHCRCPAGSLRWCPKMVPWGDVPSPVNQAREASKHTSQPKLLGLRCWREKAEAWVTHLQEKQEFTPEKCCSYWEILPLSPSAHPQP